MNIALIICLLGLAVYLICSLTGRYSEVGELARLAFFAGLLAFLMK